MATACPIEGLQCDPRFLSFLDTDKQRTHPRRRGPRRREAHRQAPPVPQGRGCPERCARARRALARGRQAQGRRRCASSRVLKAADSARISLEQVRASDPVLRAAGINGDGIVASEFLPENVRGLASRIMAAFPEVKNRAGKAGIDSATLQRFRDAKHRAPGPRGQKAAAFAWGDPSLARAQRIREVKPLLDAYFLQCRLVAAQPEAASSLKLAAGRVEGVLGDTAAAGEGRHLAAHRSGGSGWRAHLVQAVPGACLRDARGVPQGRGRRRHGRCGEADRRGLEGAVRQGRRRAGLAGHLRRQPREAACWASCPPSPTRTWRPSRPRARRTSRSRTSWTPSPSWSASSSISAGC